MLAIAVAHQLGLIHRETTPDKLLLDVKGHVKLPWAVSSASSRLDQRLASNKSVKQQQPHWDQQWQAWEQEDAAWRGISVVGNWPL